MARAGFHAPGEAPARPGDRRRILARALAALAHRPADHGGSTPLHDPRRWEQLAARPASGPPTRTSRSQGATPAAVRLAMPHALSRAGQPPCPAPDPLCSRHRSYAGARVPGACVGRERRSAFPRARRPALLSHCRGLRQLRRVRANAGARLTVRRRGAFSGARRGTPSIPRPSAGSARGRHLKPERRSRPPSARLRCLPRA